MPSTFKGIDAITSPSTATAAALASLSTTYHYNNTILLPSLEERLQLPPSLSTAFSLSSSSSSSPASSSPSSASSLGSEINSSTGLTSISHVASVVVSNFLPLSSTSLSSGDDDSTSADDTKIHSSYSPSTTSSTFYPSHSPPAVESLVASSAEDFGNNFRDLSFDIFDDNDNDLFGSPLAFDASENGLWNGRFVPPPPRPPFFVDEPVLSDGLTTCDLCSWAMPTKSTFIFEGTMERASELGWPLTLTIVSLLSAILGAIIMIAVVKCRRKKTSQQRSDTHVQWWSRNKRPNGNNNHLRRSNIYTAHPADSIRGLQQQANSLSASSSMTAMTTAMAVASAPSSIQLPYYHPQQQQSHTHNNMQAHNNGNQQQQQQQQHQQYQQQYFEHEHEYHQPQELQLQLQPQQLTPNQQQQQSLYHHHHLHHNHNHHPIMQYPNPAPRHQHSASMSSSSTISMPSLSTIPLQRQMPEQIHLQSTNQPQHVQMQHQHQQREREQQQQQQQRHHNGQQHEPELELAQSPDLHDNMFHWPTATSIVTS